MRPSPPSIHRHPDGERGGPPRRARRLCSTALTLALALTPALHGAPPASAVAADQGTSAACSESLLRTWLLQCTTDEVEQGTRLTRRDPWSVVAATDLVLELEGDAMARFVAGCAAHRRPAPCTAPAALALLEQCVTDAADLRGGRRADLSRHFAPDGGLAECLESRFNHPRCGCVKVVVTFAAPPGRATCEEPEDAIQSIHVYLGLPLYD